jgi:hypothetical protein
VETFEEINSYLLSLIPKEELERVFRSDSAADICVDFLCFADIYYNLSKIIPKDFTVIDIGCGYNAQSYFFKDFKKVYSVTPFNNRRDYKFEYFCAPNCTLLDMTAGRFLKEVLPTLNIDLSKSFAICNYVPNWYKEKPMELVSHTFQNHYVFFPNALL